MYILYIWYMSRWEENWKKIDETSYILFRFFSQRIYGEFYHGQRIKLLYWQFSSSVCSTWLSNRSGAKTEEKRERERHTGKRKWMGMGQFFFFIEMHARSRLNEINKYHMYDMHIIIIIIVTVIHIHLSRYLFYIIIYYFDCTSSSSSSIGRRSNMHVDMYYIYSYSWNG